MSDSKYVYHKIPCGRPVHLDGSEPTPAEVDAFRQHWEPSLEKAMQQSNDDEPRSPARKATPGRITNHQWNAEMTDLTEETLDKVLREAREKLAVGAQLFAHPNQRAIKYWWEGDELRWTFVTIEMAFGE